MIALVTGGAGVVGRALCRELMECGMCVRILSLPGDPQAGVLQKEVEVFYGDVTDLESIRKAFVGVDVVYHLAAILLSTTPGSFDQINVGGTRNVVKASTEAGVSRLVYVSSISVTYPVLTEYGRSKLMGESAVKSSGLAWTIVRPTLVIGEPVGSGGGIEFNMFVDYVKRFPLYFLPGGGKCLKRPVKSVDLVKGIALAGLSEHAVGKTYALAGKRILSMAEMADSVLKGCKKRHLMIPLPWWIAKKLSVLKSWIGGRPVAAEQALAGFLYDAAPNIEDAERDLGYNPGSPL
jgi:NADH dehydrogenase